MFPGISGSIEIDAHSTGQAIIPELDSAGVFLPNAIAQGWTAVYISVTEDSRGAPGSVLRRRFNQRGTAGSDIIGHYLDGGIGLSSSVIGNTFLEMGADNIGLTQDDDIDAWDFPMAVRELSPGLSNRVVFTHNVPEYYFSLTPTSANMVAGTTAFPTAHAGVIYRVVWNPPTATSSGGWSLPTVWTANGLLNLSVDDIDALTVDAGNNRVLFSTPHDPNESEKPQLWAFQRGFAAPMEPMVPGSPPRRLSEEMGVRTSSTGIGQDFDDIDALCDIDPESPLITPIDVTVGFPTPLLDVLGGTNVQLSVQRVIEDDVDHLVIQATSETPGIFNLHLSPDGFQNSVTWPSSPLPGGSPGAKATVLAEILNSGTWSFVATWTATTALGAGTELSPIVQINL